MGLLLGTTTRKYSVTDIDECEGDHPCAHTCDNLVGGYMCVCNEGFQLDVDQVSCKECDDGTYGSNCLDICACVTDNTRRCNPVNGSCICQEGWMGDTCDLDINECKDTSICPTNSQCTNTNGTFTCDCIVGYQKTGSGTCEGCQPFYFGEACAERCECNTTTTLMCDTNNGTCRCKEGWESSDCSLDVDECTAKTSICSDVSNSNCMNNPGGYECECQAGFYKEGQLCIDIDECQETKDRCNQDCEDTEGSFTCKCFDGYHGDGVNCTECDTNTYGFNCSLECPCNITNSQTGSQSCTPSTGECVCKAEWTGANCTVDVNECQNTSLCGGDDQFSGCHNLEGGYSCECYIGYRKNPVGKCIPDTSSSRTTKSALSMKEVKLALTLEVSLPAGTNLNIAATYAYYETTAIETLTAYYESVGITSVVVVINSLSEGSLKVDFTLLYEDVDDVAQRLGRATVQLTRGVDLVFQNQNVSSTLDLSENLTDICDIYESLFGQCRIGYKCQVEDNEPICKEDIVADSFGLIIGLSTGGFVALLALVLIALCMRVMREKRELKKQAVKNGECRNFENKVDCPIADTCSDRSVISGFGFNRDPSSKWFSQPRESLTASNGSNRQGFEQVTSDNRFILYRPQMSTFTPKLLLRHSNRKGYSEEVPNVPTPDYF